ncbi:hypothetical protein H310_02455 [Aphanomyces invadans]|uniref:HSF-type DNA-binding domain-containing protein n=1 Tax=Aphanomyces invadans TaxID=157072 RepID=A0A024UR46_9STRA|nr:hypothetical protein H310_02455 [Aphanomyces invadans]ETW08093.1 hypothetical protein H310_02455 [Aphanomyces invadans]RHY27498.1 hypothetical protein DYB32_007272 [Aphanomyces invadans]|eukprot:XP_008864186.1 hypothetical protein H310_02455 [Aphanomyces invadans]
MNSAPVFLQKTYDMLEVCPVGVAEWAKDGKSFVIKNTKQFESTMLPQFFKHNNFASFARQLRFYGFEKSKVHDARFNDSSESGQTWWMFQHPKFLRDDPVRMTSIRRKTCTEAVAVKWEAGEVSELKVRLSTLQDTMSVLSARISTLTAAVHEFAAAQAIDEEICDAPVAKRAKISMPTPVKVSAPLQSSSPKTVEDITAVDQQAWTFSLEDEHFPDMDDHLFASLLDFDLPLVC